MATKQTSSFDSATRKLLGATTPYPLEDLPTNNNDELWKEIRTDYGLNLPELAALKNYASLRQQQAQQTPWFNVRQGPPLELSNEQELSDVKDLAAFARKSMESQTEKRDMSKASLGFAEALLAGLRIKVETLEPEDRSTEQVEPDQYSWKAQTTAGNQVELGEHQGTPGARNWFHTNFLANSELERIGYAIRVATGSLLPTLKAAGKEAKGKGDMVIGVEAFMNIADSVYEQAPGLIELKTDEYPIKVGQIILEITAFSRISRYGKGVVLMASDCHTKWRLVWFHDHSTIRRKGYSSARRCWMDFVTLLTSAETRVHNMEPPRKKRLVRVNEDVGEQDLEGFELEGDRKQKAVDNEAMLHRLADYLGDLYGERPVVPDWARAASTCPDYYT